MYSGCVVAVSGGYPGEYKKGIEFSLDKSNDLIFFGGTEKSGNKFLTSGGRVLNVVGKGKSLEDARKEAYENIKKVHFDGIYFRKDIGEI